MSFSSLFLDQEQNDIETNLITDGFNLMKNSDPRDCFKRIICDVATGKIIVILRLVSIKISFFNVIYSPLGVLWLPKSRTSQDMDGALHTDFANFYTI